MSQRSLTVIKEGIYYLVSITKLIKYDNFQSIFNSEVVELLLFLYILLLFIFEITLTRLSLFHRDGFCLDEG